MSISVVQLCLIFKTKKNIDDEAKTNLEDGVLLTLFFTHFKCGTNHSLYGLSFHAG